MATVIPRKKRDRYRSAALAIAAAREFHLDPGDWEGIWQTLQTYGPPTYLYAIVDKTNGLVKFGRSKNPESRLKSLKTGNGVHLELLAFCAEKHEMNERQVHRRLHAWRRQGEWFEMNGPARRVIAEMNGAIKVAIREEGVVS